MYHMECLVFFFQQFMFAICSANISNLHCSNDEQYMNAFDQAMNALDERFSFLSSPKQIVSDMNEEEKVIA